MAVISLADRRLGLSRTPGSRDAGPNLQNVMLPPPPGIRAIGIDLGTTNTVVSVYEPGRDAPVTLRFDQGLLVPSVLRWDGQEVLVGAQALGAESQAFHDVVRSTKRAMGKSQRRDSSPQSEGSRRSGTAWCHSGGREFTPEEAAAAILRFVSEHPLLQEERSRFGGLWAVITVPAHFDDAARRATLEAAAQAGLSVLRIINEPTAAALAYSFLDDGSDDVRGSRQMTQDSVTRAPVTREDVVVFDLGGGTFDVSVVHREDLIFKVLASEGDVTLGGDDLDGALADRLAASVQPEFLSRRLDKSSSLYAELLAHARQIKHQLCEQGSVSVDVPVGGGMGHLAVTIERGEFEGLIAPILERTLVLTEQAIQMAKRRVRDISRILLVGGSTRTPLVRRLLEDYFSGCVVDSRLEPDVAVSWGASLQAAIILGSAPETVLIDVCNHSLGIGVVDDSEAIERHFRTVREKFGIFDELDESEVRKKLGRRMNDFNEELQKLLRVAPIIRRNSALPARKSEFFSTLYENQPAVHVVLAQGEGETVGENRFIGSFLFALHQPCPKGTKCEIQLTYDVNGMVQVFAKQLGSSNEATAQFDSRTGTVSGWSPSRLLTSEDVRTETVLPSGGQESSVSGCYEEPSSAPVVLNALLARAKRVLKLSLSKDGHHQESLTASRKALRLAIAAYERGLAESLAGQMDEATLDDIEADLCRAMADVEA